MKNWYVITGGPGVGKTSVVDILEKRGKRVLHEVARKIINHELEKGGNVLPWEKPQEFQNLIAEVQIEVEKRVAHYEELFLDRGVIDLFAFCDQYNVKKSDMLLDYLANKSYGKIFILDPIPEYKNDEGRVLSENESLEIHNRIKKWYKALGYELINVPFMTPEERVEFILSNVNSNGSGDISKQD